MPTRASRHVRTCERPRTQPLPGAGELLLEGVGRLVHELVGLEGDPQLHALLIDEGAIRLGWLLTGAPALAAPAVVDVPALPRLRLEDQRAIGAALGMRLSPPVAHEPRSAILASRLVEDAAERLRVRRELDVRQPALLRPFRSPFTRVPSEDDHADAPMLGAGDEKVGGEGVDVTVRDDHEDWQVTCERLIGALGRVRENGLELRELHEHAEERAGHRLRRQNQHFTPARA